AQIICKNNTLCTRLVWCIRRDISMLGGAKGIDASWFGSSSGFLGLRQRAARSHYDEPVAGAEWVAVSNQFFTTLIAPLSATLAGKDLDPWKANGVWGH